MGLRDILNEEIIDLNLKGTTKDEVLHELAGHLYSAGYIADVEDFVKDIYVREEEGITGMGNHIAIPHGKSSSVTRIGIAIGRTENEIEWESYDGLPVNLIFLFCVSDDSDFARNHMMLLAELAGKLGNDARVEMLQKVETKESLIEVLTSEEVEASENEVEDAEEFDESLISF